MNVNDGKNRLDTLRKLLSQGTLSTQEELKVKLEKMGHKVTQSTISRDLRRLGAVKVIDSSGQTVYKLSENRSSSSPTALSDLVLDISTNGVLVVIHTSPGSASLVARHLDQIRPGGILGTIAGDDTIFVALPRQQDSEKSIQEIRNSIKRSI
jgi:transcriptional regulator of arginine metabolism